MPGMYVMAVIVIAWMPIPIESPRGRSLCFIAYRKPVSNTMNEAPEARPGEHRERLELRDGVGAEQADGRRGDGRARQHEVGSEPPGAQLESPLANGNWPSIEGPTADAPDFISWIARMNRNIAGRNSRIFLTTYHGLRSTSNGPRSM